MSDETFLKFNTESRLDLQDNFAMRLYEDICAATPDYRGAHNLVGWKDFADRLRLHIQKSKPYLQRDRSKKRCEHYIVGSLWFEPLYQVIVSSMPEVPSREEIREHFEFFANKHTGLLPMDKTYDVIAKLGRPGLKYEQFVAFVRKLGFIISDDLLHVTFNQIDIDQNHCLGFAEAECGITLLMRSVLPDQIMELAGLTNEQIIVQTATTVLTLLVFFIFFGLSLVALVGEGGKAQSQVQSGILGIAAVGINMDDKGKDSIKDYVVRLLEQCIGTAARHAAVQAEQRGSVG